jgi:hypothetical protein
MIFFKKRVCTAHPQPKWPRNRLTRRLGTVKTFVFLHIFAVQGVNKIAIVAQNQAPNKKKVEKH